jgi:hypothetical protein
MSRHTGNDTSGHVFRFSGDFSRVPVVSRQGDDSPRRNRCTVTTETWADAPDRTAFTRRVVGVNERVDMTASSPATWAASRGRIRSLTGDSAVWTAAETGGVCTVTATPTVDGVVPCSVLMTVQEPRRRALAMLRERGYGPGMAGSGFVAEVTIQPTHVSFSRTEVQEGTVAAVASGYYDKALGWNGKVHPVGDWLPVDARNMGIKDEIGFVPPGAHGPFSAGSFLWSIPQFHRPVGDGGAGTEFYTANHVQEMSGPSGFERTSKEGAKRSRKP